MYVYLIDDTNEAYDVYVNLISSPAGHYLSRRPYLIALLKNLLSLKQLSGKRIVIEQDLGRQIGTTDVVATKESDTIYYAQAIKSQVFYRFVKNRRPQSSNVLTLVVLQDNDNNYEINDIWIGTNRPAFPGDD